MEKRRYALRLAYQGHAFRGWQRQPGMPTVQECLEAALTHIAGPVRLDAAARTDAGVHALDQVVSFSARAAVAPGFHARASARARTYLYLLGWPPPAGLAPYVWSLPDARAFPSLQVQEPDLTRAADALARAVGEHDFGGFARPGEQTARRRFDPRATVRTVTRAEVTRRGRAVRRLRPRGTRLPARD